MNKETKASTTMKHAFEKLVDDLAVAKATQKMNHKISEMVEVMHRRMTAEGNHGDFINGLTGEGLKQVIYGGSGVGLHEHAYLPDDPLVKVAMVHGGDGIVTLGELRLAEKEGRLPNTNQCSTGVRGENRPNKAQEGTPKRPRVILVEGMTGSGKSTVCDRFRTGSDIAQGIIVVHGGTGYSRTGNKLRDALGYAADDLRQAEQLDQMFREGRLKTVIWDRMAVISSQVYQGISEEYAYAINEPFLARYQPDEVFYLKISGDEAHKRMVERSRVSYSRANCREHSAKYDQVMRRFSADYNVTWLDATRPTDGIADFILGSI
jgi:thymidylate kinase